MGHPNPWIPVSWEFLSRRNKASWSKPCTLMHSYYSGASFQLFLATFPWGQTFFNFSMPPTIEKLEKTGLYMYDVIHSSLLSLSFFLFFLCFFLFSFSLGGDGPPAPSNDAPATTDGWVNLSDTKFFQQFHYNYIEKAYSFFCITEIRNSSGSRN